MAGHFTNGDAVIDARDSAPPGIGQNASATSARAEASHASLYEWKLVLACGYRRISSITGSEDAGTCADALSTCRYRTPPSDSPLYLLWQRARVPATAPWVLVGEYCGIAALPAGVPPPPAVPSLGDIQRAFHALPFSAPTVSIQPAGNLTLVNLPTFYRATWPDDAGLQPGETSRPIQLLTWSVQFRVTARTYDFHFGDGTSTGPVTEAGGVYPDGAIRHTYAHPIAAADVRVDATLTGQFRANGGEWVDVDTIADLQNEPVTVLHVKAAHARLVAR